MMNFTPATPKQMAYLRKLVANTGQDFSEFLVENGSTEPTWPTGVHAVAPTKLMASRLIDMLKSGRSAEDGRRLACDNDDMMTMGYR